MPPFGHSQQPLHQPLLYQLYQPHQPTAPLVDSHDCMSQSALLFVFDERAT